MLEIKGIDSHEKTLFIYCLTTNSLYKVYTHTSIYKLTYAHDCANNTRVRIHIPNTY